MGREKFFTHLDRLLLEGGRHRVVPAIEKAEQRDDTDDFNDLALRPVPLQLREGIVGDGIGLRSRLDRKVERDALRLGIERVRAVLSDRGKLFLVNPEPERPPGGVRYSVMAAVRAACNMRDQAL